MTDFQVNGRPTPVARALEPRPSGVSQLVSGATAAATNGGGVALTSTIGVGALGGVGLLAWGLRTHKLPLAIIGGVAAAALGATALVRAFGHHGAAATAPAQAPTPADTDNVDLPPTAGGDGPTGTAGGDGSTTPPPATGPGTSGGDGNGGTATGDGDGGTSTGDGGTATGDGAPLKLAQFNVKNLFDTVDDPHHSDTVDTAAQYQLHLTKLALAVRDSLGTPDVVALEEVENQQVLDDLLKQPELQGLGYRAVLQEGTDPRGIDVGMLYRANRVTLESATQLDPHSLSTTGRSVHVFTRPPLVAEFGINGTTDAAGGARQLTVLANHFTSKLGGAAAAVKREQQATAVAGLVDAKLAANASADVAVLGDLNMSSAEPEFAPLTGVRSNGAPLTDEVDSVPLAERYSWRSGNKTELFDHALLSSHLAAQVATVAIPHIDTRAPRGAATNPAVPEGVSDHDPVIVTMAS